LTFVFRCISVVLPFHFKNQKADRQQEDSRPVAVADVFLIEVSSADR
jgi:hypothetical protein